MDMSNKEKLVKRFNELCGLISNGNLVEHDSKMGMLKDVRSIGGVFNELKLIQYALDMSNKLEDDDLEEISDIVEQARQVKKIMEEEIVKILGNIKPDNR